MRFASSSLSTSERQGDWSSPNGNRERSPVSEKCKYSTIQQPQSRRDLDENNSYCTAPTGKEQRTLRVETGGESGRGTQLFKKVIIQEDLERNVDLKIEGGETGTNVIVWVYKTDFGHTCGKAREPKRRL